MRLLFVFLLLLYSQAGFCWGFFGHRKINYCAVFLLPPELIAFYKPHLSYLSDHAVDPDKRRYAIAEEGPRHYLDLDHYGRYPFDSLPRRWEDAVARFGADTLQQHGIVPWWIAVMQQRLTKAFREGDGAQVLKLSAEIGHYIADAHVPLHASSNHNGQLTGQRGIHGFWESRLPELLADSAWDFFIGKATYIAAPLSFAWSRLLESAAAADTVLRLERALTAVYPPDRKFAFEQRNGQLVRQYSAAFSLAYDALLGGMVERRMRQSIYAVASFWYTAWVDAGQPDMHKLSTINFTEEKAAALQQLSLDWRECEYE